MILDMANRPLSVTVICWVYLVTGAAGFIYHLGEFRSLPFPLDTLWVELVRIAAVIAGWFMLSGRNWARWLALAWIAFHVVIGALHSVTQLIVHALFCIIIGYILFRPAAARFFGRAVS